MCGEAFAALENDFLDYGLSPHVRGSRVKISKVLTLKRSIPACAGKPGYCVGRLPSMTVYPRMCGEAPDGASTEQYHEGLSPHVRGSLG